MLVALPSGAIATLEVPSLESVLCCNASPAAIAACAWAHDGLDLSDLEDGDLLFVAIWALRELATSDAGREFAATYLACGSVPSREAGIFNRLLAWEFNHTAVIALQKREREGKAGQAREPDNEHQATYRVPDDWSGDDD